MDTRFMVGKDAKPSGTYWDIYQILKELYITSFKWKNVPDRINERYLEMSLFDYGRCVFFEDETIGYLALKATLAGNLDVYYEPTNIRAYGGNGYQKKLKNHEDSVMIYNNYNRDVPHHRILDYAKRIHNIEKTIDTNVHSQKTPYLLKGNKKQVQSLKHMYKKLEENELFIIIDESVNEDAIDSVNTQAPFVASDLQELKRKIWNEALSFIGIENNFSEKNERLTQGEVMVSNGLSKANRNSRYRAREKAVEEINELFGLEIEVEYVNPSIDMVNEVDNPLIQSSDDREGDFDE